MWTIGLGHIDPVPILFGRADVEPGDVMGKVSWNSTGLTLWKVHLARENGQF